MVDREWLEASMGQFVGTSTDENSFRELYERHHRAVLAYLLRRVHRDVAYDAAEDVFLIAWRRIDDVPPDDGAIAWLYGVARRVLANHRRSTVRLGRLTHRIAGSPTDPAPGPETETIDNLEKQVLLDTLRTLSERDQEVLRLVYWEELPHSDIGRILGCSTGAVHVRRHRAVQRLANALRRGGHIPVGRLASLSDRKGERC